jgi:hypothetical protein
MILLHAIVPGDVPDVPDPGLRSHEAGNVTVLYEERDAPPPSDRPAVLAHGRRVVALAERVPLLPVRYGTTLAGVEELSTIVEEHADAWSRSLARLAGRGELVVHLDLTEAPHDKRPEESGRAYLLRRTEVVRRQDRARDEARAVVAPWSEETRLLNDQRRLAVLLPRTDAETACEALAAWAQACDDLEVLVTGPWPPFSFCEEAGLP